MSNTQGKTALLFPGQGAQDLQMLDKVKLMAQFPQRYALVCEFLGSHPQQEIDQGNQTYLNQNLVSSMLTLLVSSLLLDRYLKSEHRIPTFLAGYSVGQWLALYAANVVTFETMLTIVQRRAELMDRCFAETPGAMLAVIGLPEARLQALCQELTEAGEYLVISNYNCVGQFSLAGTTAAVALAHERIQQYKPKKVIRLPVSGAWHCALLNDAATAFGAYLQDVSLRQLNLPVIDNVTGNFLPSTAAALKGQLASHLCAPVRWDKGIKTLIAQGCTEFVEIGYGNTLTKFGFFINRTVQHRSFAPTA